MALEYFLKFLWRFEGLVSIQGLNEGYVDGRWNMSLLMHCIWSCINDGLWFLLLIWIVLDQFLDIFIVLDFRSIQLIIEIIRAGWSGVNSLEWWLFVAFFDSSLFELPFGEGSIEDPYVWMSEYFKHPIGSRGMNHSRLVIDHDLITSSQIKGFHLLHKVINCWQHEHVWVGRVADFV